MSGVAPYWDQSVESTMAARWAPAEWPHRYRPLNKEPHRDYLNTLELILVKITMVNVLQTLLLTYLFFFFTWYESTAEWQKQRSCEPGTPSDPCYLKGKRSTQLTFPVYLLRLSFYLQIRNDSTFGGNVVANGNHNHVLINEWDSHKSRLLFAAKTSLFNLMS